MNKYLLTGFCAITFLIFFCNCTEKQEIKSIYAKYYISVFKAITDISYEELENSKPQIDTLWFSEKIYNLDGIKDTLLTNSQVLFQIQKALKKIKISPQKSTVDDVRIICIIEYQDGKKEELSIDGIYTSYLKLNGCHCEDCFELIYLIKKNIGFYSGMDESGLSLFYELQDSCFKDTIINDQGQKYWRGKPVKLRPIDNTLF